MNSNKNKNNNKKKAQTTLEILVIFGILVIGAVVFGTYYFTAFNEKIGDAPEISDSTTTYIGTMGTVDPITPDLNDTFIINPPEEPPEPPICSSGDGTINNPKVICTAQELNDIRNNLNWHYVLGSDIDLNHTLLSADSNGNWYDKTFGWEPIGKRDSKFTGSVNGNNFTINNLYINRPTGIGIGLFGYTQGSSSIKNLNLNNVFVVGQKNVGALIGVNESLVDNCNINGIVKGVSKTGGLVGFSLGEIKNSDSEGQVHILPGIGEIIFNIEFHFVGGLIGVSEAKVDNCYSKTNIYILENGTYNHIGGLIGISTNEVINSYSINPEHKDLFVFDSAVNNFIGKHIGGLIGSQDYNSKGDISNCYSERNIITKQDFNDMYIGGLVGLLYGSSIIDCNVSGNIVAGGKQQYTDQYGSIGGIVGGARGNSLKNTTLSANFSGDVNGHTRVGGIAGSFAGAYGGFDEQIINSNVIGNINGVQSVGGLIGAGHTDIIDSNFSGTVTGSDSIGGLAGDLGSAEKVCIVSNSNTSGYINAFGPGEISYGSIGGLIGWSEVLIYDSYSEMDINANMHSGVGGLVGSNNNGIYKSHYVGNIFSPNAQIVGGLVGSMGFDVNISECYANSNIIAGSGIGGFVGDFYSGEINNSYSTGSIYATNQPSVLGGFVGSNVGKIKNSYSTTLVDNLDNNFIGGFVGSSGTVASGYYGNSAEYVDCYWDTELTGILDTNGAGEMYIQISDTDYNVEYGGTPEGIFGKNTMDMKSLITFKNWDFSSIWDIQQSITYPFLRFENSRTSVEKNNNLLRELGTLILSKDSGNDLEIIDKGDREKVSDYVFP